MLFTVRCQPPAVYCPLFIVNCQLSTTKIADADEKSERSGPTGEAGRFGVEKERIGEMLLIERAIKRVGKRSVAVQVRQIVDGAANASRAIRRRLFDIPKLVLMSDGRRRRRRRGHWLGGRRFGRRF